jgi:hypothetical protein
MLAEIGNWANFVQEDGEMVLGDSLQDTLNALENVAGFIGGFSNSQTADCSVLTVFISIFLAINLFGD